MARLGWKGRSSRVHECIFITALVLLKMQKSVAVENGYLETVEPGDDPDFRVAV